MGKNNQFNQQSDPYKVGTVLFTVGDTKVV